MPRKKRLILRRFITDMGSPSWGCELGVWRGGTSKFLLESFPFLQLIMVDQFLPCRTGGRVGPITNRLRQQKYVTEAYLTAYQSTRFAARRRTILVCDSAKASGFVPDNLLDFVFIDADHRREFIHNDLACWVPKVRIGGLVCGDDYVAGKWGVKSEVDEYTNGTARVVGPIWGFFRTIR